MNSSSVVNYVSKGLASFVMNDFKPIVFAALKPKELIVMSRVCRLWYVSITQEDTGLWQGKLDLVNRCLKMFPGGDPFPELVGKESPYTTWSLFVNKLSARTRHNTPLLNISIPLLDMMAFSRTNKKERLEHVAREGARYAQIDSVQKAFLDVIALYSCDVMDASLIGKYIAFSKKSGFVFDNLASLALIFLWRDGAVEAFFNSDLDDESHASGVARLVEYSLKNNKCDEALQWIKSHLTVLEHKYHMKKEVLISFCKKAIKEKKIELIRELFSHMLSDCQGNKKGRVVTIKKCVRETLEALRRQGHGDIIELISVSFY